MEKNSFFWISVILAIGLVFVIWNSGSTNNIDQITLTQEPNTIFSQGDAETEVAPDQAIVSIGYYVTMSDAKSAQEDNARVINDILEALDDIGYTDKDIETTYFDVSPNRVWRNDNYITEGYKATHRLKLTTDNIDEVGKIIDAAVDAGANDIDSINFELKEETRDKIREQLFAEAAQNARDKAENIATGLGVTVTGVRSASINDFYYPMYRADYAMAASVDMAESAPTQIQYGDLTVSVSVSVSFLI